MSGHKRRQYAALKPSAMNIINLGEQNSIICQYLAEIRDKVIQKDRMRFRNNLERIAECIAYEISKTLQYQEQEVTTPLGIAKCKMLDTKVVIASIMRAGLPLHNGMLRVFDKAENAFIAAFRKYGKDNKFSIHADYTSCPQIEGKTLVLADCMMATGSSIILTYSNLCENGEPEYTHIVTLIASKAAVAALSKQLPHKKVTLWVGAIDEELTNKAYIIPGLGDAGDLAYGEKMEII